MAWRLVDDERTRDEMTVRELLATMELERAQVGATLEVLRRLQREREWPGRRTPLAPYIEAEVDWAFAAITTTYGISTLEIQRPPSLPNARQSPGALSADAQTKSTAPNNSSGASSTTTVADVPQTSEDEK